MMLSLLNALIGVWEVKSSNEPILCIMSLSVVIPKWYIAVYFSFDNDYTTTYVVPMHGFTN
jgi:hypothetical protein